MEEERYENNSKYTHDEEKNSEFSKVLTIRKIDYEIEYVNSAKYPKEERCSLDLKKLTNLPENFGSKFENIINLDLSNNELTNVPLSLKSLVKLEQLVLDNNRIRYLPLEVTEIISLVSLSLSKNLLTSLPECVSNLKLLEILDLSSNKLSDLPRSCRELTKLRQLNLSKNCLKLLPECIAIGIHNLEILDLSWNLYINLSSKPASEKLKRLYVREAGSNVKFPVWILKGYAPNLEILDLDGTSFGPFDFPDKCSYIRIKTLSLRRCGISDDFLHKMTNCAVELVTLRVGNEDSTIRSNSFWQTPIESLKHPENIEKIDLRFTGLSMIHDRIENFVNLVELDVGRNTLHWLPNQICCLNKLEVLEIDQNSLSDLPSNIGGMKSLRELRANSNNLAALPESFQELDNLLYLDLYENNFSHFPTFLGRVEKLIGLDIDKNSLDTEDPRIVGSKYRELRQVLRIRYRIGDERQIGPRYETEIEEQSYGSSDGSSMDRYEYDTKIRESVVHPMQEDWDISEDSADEYDPNCINDVSRKRPSTKFSYMDAVTRGFLFCPANSHPLSIKQKIAELKKKGLYQKYTDAEIEGQFDDA